MRQMTMTMEIRRPTPENSAIETNWAVSESGKADEETPALFGMDCSPVLFDQKAPIVRMSGNDD
jgi:hypothetical protein